MKLIFQILVPFLILGGAYLGIKKLIDLKPPAKRKTPVKVIPEVSPTTISPASHYATVKAFGTVNTRDEARITSQVNARILKVSEQFRVGNFIKKGTTLVELERTDLESALANQTSSLADIERQLAEERVRSTQAKQDWVASGRKLETASDFRLRKPQLKALEARLLSIESSIKKAQADLGRTKILAPYDCLVAERNANIGELATTQSTLGKVFATDKAEIRFSLTPAQVRLVQPVLKQAVKQQQKPEVNITLPHRESISRKALLTRVDPQIDPRNQVLFAIAEVQDPFSSKLGRLAIGSFVHATLQGPKFDNCYAIPESALINDSYIWTVKDKVLVKINVERIFNNGSYAYCRLKDHEGEIHIIARPLVSFGNGLEVNIKAAE